MELSIAILPFEALSQGWCAIFLAVTDEDLEMEQVCHLNRDRPKRRNNLDLGAVPGYRRRSLIGSIS